MVRAPAMQAGDRGSNPTQLFSLKLADCFDLELLRHTTHRTLCKCYAQLDLCSCHESRNTSSNQALVWWVWPTGIGSTGVALRRRVYCT